MESSGSSDDQISPSIAMFRAMHLGFTDGWAHVGDEVEMWLQWTLFISSHFSLCSPWKSTRVLFYLFIISNLILDLLITVF
jgi:hypothetical protein